MIANGHLTKRQLSDYSVGALDERASRTAGRHLMDCPDCRGALPAPTTGQFRSALMLEHADGGQAASGKCNSSLARKPFGLLWGISAKARFGMVRRSFVGRFEHLPGGRAQPIRAERERGRGHAGHSIQNRRKQVRLQLPAGSRTALRRRSRATIEMRQRNLNAR